VRDFKWPADALFDEALSRSYGLTRGELGWGLDVVVVAGQAIGLDLARCVAGQAVLTLDRSEFALLTLREWVATLAGLIVSGRHMSAVIKRGERLTLGLVCGPLDSGIFAGMAFKADPGSFGVL